MPRRLIVLAVIIGITGCQLVETVVAPGERTVVVQSVIDRGQPQQFTLLEYSSIGDRTSNGVGNGISGASVTVEHLAGSACPGLVETLAEVLPTGMAVVPTGRYAGPLTCLGPGERLALRVTTPAGELVTGETVIPAADMRSVRAGASAARFVMDTVRFDRDRDTLRVTMKTRQGRGMQIEIRRAENHDQVSVIFINDSLGVAFPGNLVNPFEDNGETTFRAGAYYLMTVALADSNYFDYARTFSDPITGRGFLNHLKGGLGVFGSVETASYILRTVGTVNDPREGVYRITGQVGNANLDATLEAYVDDLHNQAFSGFMTGAWVNGAINTSGDGIWGFSSGGESNPDAFFFSFTVRRATPPTFRRYALRGVRPTDGSPFSINLIATNQGGQLVLNTTVTGVQVSGPGIQQ